MALRPVRVLFLGGTGNISSACAELALAGGHELTLLHRGRSPSPLEARVRTLVGDRDDAALLRRVASEMRYDAVVDFVAFTAAQVEAAIAAFAGRAGQYVFISSAAVYQRPSSLPVITEAAPLGNPFWEYARHKIACELLLSQAHREQGFPATIVRPSYTYGPTWIPSAVGHDYTVVDRIRQGRPIISHGDGTSLWVMTSAADFAHGLLGLLGNPGALGEAVHVTSDEVLTWDQIYRTIGRAAGAEAQIVHVPSDLIAALWPERAGSLLGDKAHSVVFDNGKIKRLVPGFRAAVTFDQGIAGSLAWFDAEPARRVVNEETHRAMDWIITAQRGALGDAAH